MRKITTVVFDMYETLAWNTREMWMDSFRTVCRSQGLTVDPEALFKEWKEPEVAFRANRYNLKDPDKSPPFVSYEDAWRECFRIAFSKMDLEGDSTAAARQTVLDLGERDPYQDALDALPEIQAGWRTGILSNSDDGFLLPLVDRIGWRFEAVLSSEGARAYKPAAGPFRRVLDMLQVGAEETVFVGDTPYDDVLGAKGVGMRAVWINRNGAPRDPRAPEPNYEIADLKEVPKILRALS